MWLINLLFKSRSNKKKKQELSKRVKQIITKDTLRARVTKIVKQDNDEKKKAPKVIVIIKRAIRVIKECISNGHILRNTRKKQDKGEDNDGKEN